LIINDLQFGIPLIFNPVVSSLSDPSGPFRGAGLRNIKYYPDAGTAGQQSNDMTIFRLADIFLMRAEADIRLNGTISGTSLGYVNQVRTRAYSGDASHNWTAVQATLDGILAERARELAWEGWRRNDLIRYDVENGTVSSYFGAARNPAKTADPDAHLQLFPVPSAQITANPNLAQNPGY
jgi:hypothetical protein